MPAQHGVAVVLTDQRIRGDRHVHVHADLGGVLEEPDQGIGAALIQGAVGTLAVGIRAVVLLREFGQRLVEDLGVLGGHPGGDVGHAVSGGEDRHATVVEGLLPQVLPGIAVAGQPQKVLPQLVGGVVATVGDGVALHVAARNPPGEVRQHLDDQPRLRQVDPPLGQRLPHQWPPNQREGIPEQMVGRTRGDAQ